MNGLSERHSSNPQILVPVGKPHRAVFGPHRKHGPLLRLGSANRNMNNSSLSATAVSGLRPSLHAAPGAIALYVHIPFCLSKCNYCDFNTYEGIETLMPTFVDALSKEIAIWGQRLSRPNVSTVFFGGGTPSYLPEHSIQHLLETIRECTRLDENAEITLEANPDDLTSDKADAWADAGFNRISIGVQSFHDGILAALSRRHSAVAASKAVKTARDAGFQNINIDLMYGLPKQSLGQWRHSLPHALDLHPEHISLYGLQIEPGTPLHRDVQVGKLPTPSDDLAADMYEVAMDDLADAGYEHYEISNWAKPGFRSRHNSAYWLNLPYLGVGPGAHSSLNGRRFANTKSPRGYIHAIANVDLNQVVQTSEVDAGVFAVDFIEVTSPQTAISETMMLGMRLAEGISKSEFHSRFNASLDNVYRAEIEYLTDAGLIETQGERIALTRRGKLLANTVFEQFLLTDEE